MAHQNAPMDSIHALRYAVYCKEKSFLNAKDYPDGMEYDDFDDYSVHFAALDRNKAIAGTMRLVIPTGDQVFPYEKYCRPFASHVPPPKGKVGEISRLIIAQEFRVKDDHQEFGFTSALSRIAGRWRKETQPEFTLVAPAVDQSTSPRILLGLFRKMYRYSLDHEITHLYAAMEATLARLLMRYQLIFHRISDRIDYYGPVALYFASFEEIETRLARSNPDLLRWMRKERPAKPPPDQ